VASEVARGYRHRGLDINLRSGPQMLEYEAIVARIAADRPGCLLDWGAGFGQVTAMLRDAGVDVTAFDYQPGVEDGVHPLERSPGSRCTCRATRARFPSMTRPSTPC
jgi:hypothetical protein